MTTNEYHQDHTDLRVDTTVTQRPRLTGLLTHRTHDGSVGFTNLFTDETMNQETTATIKNIHVLNYTFYINIQGVCALSYMLCGLCELTLLG